VRKLDVLSSYKKLVSLADKCNLNIAYSSKETEEHTKLKRCAAGS
jgi:hypothetical protein